MQFNEALPAGPQRDALVQAIRALEAAEQPPSPPAQRMQALAEVARCYREMQSLDAAKGYLMQALRWSQCVGSADASVELLCDLAELAAQQAGHLAHADPRAAHQAREEARDHAFEAARRARCAADSHWEVHVLLRASEVLDRFGDHDDAIALQCRALHLLVQDEVPSLDMAPNGEGGRLM